MKPAIKQNTFTLGFILLYLMTGIYSLWKVNYTALFIICIFAIVTTLAMHFERRKIYRELSEISSCIDSIINQNPLLDMHPYEEYMTSKIYHQLTRLSTIFQQQQEHITKDRDEIRFLINDIAHQMRTPLANMKLFLELLEMEEVSKEQSEYTHQVEKAMESLTFLTESFIKMSRIEGNIIQLKIRMQSITKTIQEAIGANTEDAKNKHITIQYDPISYEVEHDRQWLKEAIINLIHNAIKYSEPDTTITISLVQNEMFLEIQIEDEGIGIDKCEENLIFKRFY